VSSRIENAKNCENGAHHEANQQSGSKGN
jgi:hypothetical protein